MDDRSCPVPVRSLGSRRSCAAGRVLSQRSRVHRRRDRRRCLRGSWCEVPHRFPARSEAQRRKPGPGVCVARVELSRAPVELSPRARVRVIPHRGERPRSRSQSLRCREGVVGVGAIRKPRVFDRLSGGFVRSDMFRCVGMGKQIRVVHAVSLRMKRSADTHCGRTDDDRIARWSHLSCVDDSR